jgi:hypothetical protein
MANVREKVLCVAWFIGGISMFTYEVYQEGITDFVSLN